MSNESGRPDDDVPTGAAGDPAARPDVPPADARRIAASQDAAASAEEPRLAEPASSGLGSGSGVAEPDVAPEPGAGARDQAVAGNEPVTPAGPAVVPGARPAPSSDPVAPAADERGSDSPAADEPAAGAPAAHQPPAAFPAQGGHPGASAAEPAAGGNGRKILIGALVAVLVVLVVLGVRYFVSDRAGVEAGDCVGLSAESDDRAEVHDHDCADAEATYQVAKVLDTTDATCPEEGLYTEISPVGSVGDGYKLCLLPNMAEGACYKPEEGGSAFVKTDCVGPETFKVTKLIKGSTDLEACPDGSGMAYPEPAVTYCLAPAEM